MKINNQKLTQFILYLDIKFISGKYFKDGIEIREIKEYITDKYLTTFTELPTDTNYKYILEGIKNLPGVDHHSKWIDLPIIQEFKNLKEEDKLAIMCEPLPFPLEDKQLIIINRLLFHPEDEHAFITTGVGGSGKSTFLNIVRQLFDNDCSPCTVGDLKNSFMLAEAVKHRLIASDELAKDDLDEGVLKTLISKQPITCNPKNEKPYETLVQSCVFWCCNTAPRIDLTDTGILRRIIYYERNTKIKNPDKSLNKKEYSKEELLNIVVHASMMEVDDFEDKFKIETMKYLKKNHSISIWWNKQNKFPKKDIWVRNEDAYECYTSWCSQFGYKRCNLSNFEEICMLLF